MPLVRRLSLSGAAVSGVHTRLVLEYVLVDRHDNDLCMHYSEIVIAIIPLASNLRPGLVGGF